MKMYMILLRQLTMFATTLLLVTVYVCISGERGRWRRNGCEQEQNKDKGVGSNGDVDIYVRG